VIKRCFECGSEELDADGNCTDPLCWGFRGKKAGASNERHLRQAEDQTDKIVYFKPVTLGALLARRKYQRAYMRRWRAAQRTAYLASIGVAPG
jgi:hypothetical protein